MIEDVPKKPYKIRLFVLMSYNIYCKMLKNTFETNRKRTRTHKKRVVTSTDALFFFAIDKKKMEIGRASCRERV